MKSSTSETNGSHFDTSFIYKEYRETISELIAYIEVYEHDLPIEIMAQMAELFQNISLCETWEGSPKNDGLQSILEQTSWEITQSLYKHLICLFLKKMQEYKKIFRKHKYKGVLIEGRKFYQLAREKEKSLCMSFSATLRAYYKGRTLHTLKKLSFKEGFAYICSKFRVCLPPSFLVLRPEPFLPVDRLVSSGVLVANLKDSYLEAKELLGKYQTVFPDVIKNGRNSSLAMSVFLSITTWIVPVVLSIPVIQKIAYIAKNFICK